MTCERKDGEIERVNKDNQVRKDRQEAMVPRRRQLMQHLWQTCGRVRSACRRHGGCCRRTSYKRPTTSCTPEASSQQQSRQDEKP